MIEVNSHSNSLSSLVTKETGCGTSNVPWILEAAPGQTLKLTLLDFTWDEPSGHSDLVKSSICSYDYGYMIDLETDITKSICGTYGVLRHKQEMLSSGNRVQVMMSDRAVAEKTFLIQYQGIHLISNIIEFALLVNLSFIFDIPLM